MAENGAKVLYISYDGMTDPLGQSQVIPYLKGLSAAGFRFTLLSFEKNERYQQHATEVAQLLNEAAIEWVPLTYTKRPPILSTIWDLLKMRRKAFALQRSHHFSIVHCRSYIASFAGLALKQQFGVKFIFDMRGFYADERVDGHIWNLKNPVYRLIYQFFKRKEQQFLAQADCIISLTYKARNIIHSWKQIPGQPLPIQVIPCCADLDHFSPANVDYALRSALQKRLDLHDDDFVLVYLGSIGTWYMLPEMLDFFAAILNQRPGARFLFITTDPPETIFREARKKGIPDSSLRIVAAGRKQLPTYLSLATWSVFFIQPVFSKSASSPTKQGELMGMGIPLVCNTGVGDVDRIMNRVPEAGISMDLSDRMDEQLVQRLLTATPDRASIIQAAPDIYSLTQGIQQYETVYRTLLDRGV